MSFVSFFFLNRERKVVQVFDSGNLVYVGSQLLRRNFSEIGGDRIFSLAVHMVDGKWKSFFPFEDFSWKILLN